MSSEGWQQRPVVPQRHIFCLVGPKFGAVRAPCSHQFGDGHQFALSCLRLTLTRANLLKRPQSSVLGVATRRDLSSTHAALIARRRVISL
ncbi:hypothetical protein AAFF_G00039820 [Aldrovandia affinis]|uniref:Uncharacterized protein n=1 Tax=Aldrovandia affinis TaxID=143900 RepID=A0AAD7S597_9TELE|nr:hypothetical protein AAFF_G00039820 [Aldrovandia affinis]